MRQPQLCGAGVGGQFMSLPSTQGLGNNSNGTSIHNIPEERNSGSYIMAAVATVILLRFSQPHFKDNHAGSYTPCSSDVARELRALGHGQAQRNLSGLERPAPVLQHAPAPPSGSGLELEVEDLGLGLVGVSVSRTAQKQHLSLYNTLHGTAWIYIYIYMKDPDLVVIPTNFLHRLPQILTPFFCDASVFP